MRRLCLESRCPNDATYRGYCQAHTRQRSRQAGPRIYDKVKWHRTRRAYLFEHPLCECGCGALAEDVHHKQAIEDGGNPWAWDNLQALTHVCHAKLTRREQGAIHGST